MMNRLPYRDDPANLERLYEEQQAEMHATVGQATINEGRTAE